MKNSLLFLLLFVTSVQANFPGYQDFLWHSRVVITQLTDNTSVEALNEEFIKLENALKERKILVVVVTENDIWTHPELTINKQSFRAETLKKLDKRSTALIGLDGGLKGYYELLDWQSIFRDIDGMPMRQTEILTERI